MYASPVRPACLSACCPSIEMCEMDCGHCTTLLSEGQTDSNRQWITRGHPLLPVDSLCFGPTGPGFVEPAPTQAYISQNRKELSMGKTLRVPNEARFVRAFALTVDPGDTLGLLMEIGALSSPDVGILRRTREALLPAYDRASDLKNWEEAHTIGVLREALAQPDSAAYLAYRVRDSHGATRTAAEYAEALAVIGCAADTLGLRRRPWAVERSDLSLPEWRTRIWNLLFALPGNALPKPADLTSDPGDGSPVAMEEGRKP